MGRSEKQKAEDAIRIDVVRQLVRAGFLNDYIARLLGIKVSCLRVFLYRHKVPSNPGLGGKRNHARYKGGRIVRKDGYVYLSGMQHHPRHYKGEVLEHRVVMETKLGRFLTAEEVVHHIDYNKQNNDINNLMLFKSQKAHFFYEKNICVHPNNPRN